MKVINENHRERCYTYFVQDNIYYIRIWDGSDTIKISLSSIDRKILREILKIEIKEIKTICPYCQTDPNIKEEVKEDA